MYPSPWSIFWMFTIGSKNFYGSLIMMSKSCPHVRERKSAVPVVSVSQITHFEDPELLFLLGAVRKHQCCHADAITASKSRLSETPAD